MYELEQKLHIFESLYVANVAVLIRFAMRYVSPDVSEDIVHEVYFELWKDNKIIERELKFSYLLTAVRNKCINYAKQNESRRKHIGKIVAETDDSDDQASIERNWEEEEHLKLIYDQIDLLPDKCRMIFKMAYFDGKKSNEIAENLNLSVRTVEHQLYLGLKSIRTIIKKKIE